MDRVVVEPLRDRSRVRDHDREAIEAFLADHRDDNIIVATVRRPIAGGRWIQRYMTTNVAVHRGDSILGERLATTRKGIVNRRVLLAVPDGTYTLAVSLARADEEQVFTADLRGRDLLEVHVEIRNDTKATLARRPRTHTVAHRTLRRQG